MGILARTLCLLSPNTTAFSFPTSKSTSSSARKRTRIISSSASTSGGKMTLSTFIYISLAVITLSLSPSAYADLGCTPIFVPLDDEYGGLEDGSALGMSISGGESTMKKTEFVVREGSSFKMKCYLSMFHSLKWTINNREITPRLEDEWNMDIKTENVVNGFIRSELRVENASTKFHPGEYKCTTVCLHDAPGSNLGVKVTVSTAIHVALNTNITSPHLDGQGKSEYRKFVPREKRVEIVCTAFTPGAKMTWVREIKGMADEDMDKVCGIPDKELTDRKKPPEHCKITREEHKETTILKLEIKRVRKEGNATLNTISDFRKYTCKASKEENQQEGRVTVELLERVSATRNFGRGVQSLTVLQGDKLQIYCDIHGVDMKEFEGGKTSVVWTKDGVDFNIDEQKDVKKIAEKAEDEKGKPYRVGFEYEMADTEHRGHYVCNVQRIGESNQDTESGTATGSGSSFASFTYYVRIKDKLGALWPFLGICGEVVILCTIILIYEKRRSKAELEESDTDGSPDQNNSNSNN